MWLLLLSCIVSLQSSCGTGSQDGCSNHLKEKIRPGLASEVADADLEKCGFKTSMDAAQKTLYGDKRIRKGLIFERTQVVIVLNADNTVATITVNNGLVGP